MIFPGQIICFVIFNIFSLSRYFDGSKFTSHFIGILSKLIQAPHIFLCVGSFRMSNQLPNSSTSTKTSLGHQKTLLPIQLVVACIKKSCIIGLFKTKSHTLNIRLTWVIVHFCSSCKLFVFITWCELVKCTCDGYILEHNFFKPVYRYSLDEVFVDDAKCDMVL